MITDKDVAYAVNDTVDMILLVYGRPATRVEITHYCFIFGQYKK